MREMHRRKHHKHKLGQNILNNSYFNEIRPVLEVYRALGRFPYKITESGVQTFSFWSLPVLYTVIFYIFTSVIGVIMIDDLINGKLLKARQYDQFLISLQLVMLQTHHLIVPPIYWFGSPKVLKYINLWTTLQLVQHRTDDWLPRVKRTKCYCLALAVFLTVVISLTAYLQVKIEPFLVATYAPVFLPMYCDCVLWWFTLFKIRNLIKKLYSDILMTGLKVDLERRRQSWLFLSRLTVEAGSVYSHILIVSFISCFVCFFASSYGFFYNLFFHPRGIVIQWGYLACALIMIGGHYSVSEAAYSTTHAVSVKFSYNILSTDLSTFNSKTMNEVLCFIRTIMANPPIIELGGFVVIDKTRIVSFLANMVTYLVVLLQFSAASKEDCKGKESTNGVPNQH